MRPLDAAAMAAVRAGDADREALGRLADLAVWLAGVTGAARPCVRARVVVVAAAPVGAREGAEVVVVPGTAPLAVAEVAAAVDRGRDLAGRAAADGVTILAAAGAASATALAAWIGGRDPAAASGPLGALRRLGDGPTAVLCGLALGAGEHGLGLVCDGLAATTGAAVAVAVEPDLHPRLLAADRSPEPAHAALLEHLGLDPVVDLGLRLADGTGALAALAVLRVAAGA